MDKDVLSVSPVFVNVFLILCLIVLSLSSSMSGMTASTTNYLWSIQDVLGQGATASVYKARNKVARHTVCDFIILTNCQVVVVLLSRSFTLLLPDVSAYFLTRRHHQDVG